MEKILSELNRDAFAPKFANIKTSCHIALDTLQKCNDNCGNGIPAFEIREKCLHPLQLALESHSHRLASHATSGLQVMLKDERFHSTLESEREENWFPLQILTVISTLPRLSEETQVEISKVLLNMTYQSMWCMNACVIIKISEVLMETYPVGNSMVKTAVEATMSQMLANFTESITSDDDNDENKKTSNLLTDESEEPVQKESNLAEDVILILDFLVNRCNSSLLHQQTKTIIPLLLQGIYAILHKVPGSICQYSCFTDFLWQELCPTLVNLLGNPIDDEKSLVNKPETDENLGRGSACSTASPALPLFTAKVIYGISVELVRLVGNVGALRTVLESLFHRMLLYHPPQHRHDGLRAVKEIFSNLSYVAKQSGQSNKPKSIRLHAAHVLSMDILITSGLEMGSHSADCWQHVFKCCAHISELEHRHYSTTIHKGQNLPNTAECAAQDYIRTNLSVHIPTTPSINIPEFIKQSSIESCWDQSITGGGVLTVEQTCKVLYGLSQEVDRLFEESSRCLNLASLLGFLSKLCESSRTQLQSYHSPDNSASSSHVKLPPNALHLYRLQDTLMKIIQSGRPLYHILCAWTVTSPFLVEAAGHHDRTVSKMAVSCIHSFITSMLTSHVEQPHFHSNELLCKTLENLLCMEICDGDVQDQVVCSICELVEACASDIRSGWRPLFAALRAVKVEFTSSEEVNETRQHHITTVLDIFDVFLNTDNVFVIAYASVDCILCLLKYVRGPSAFHDVSDSDSDSESCYSIPVDPATLCIPALKYLQQCCNLLATMWRMPACPTFNGASRIQSLMNDTFVDPVIPRLDMASFQELFHGNQTDNLPKTPESSYSKDLECVDKNDYRTENTERDPDCDAERVSAKSAARHSGDDDPCGKACNDVDDDGDDKNGSSDKTTEIESVGNNVQSSDGVDETHIKALNPPKNDVRNVAKDTSHLVPTLNDLDSHTGILHVWYLVLEGLCSSISLCPKSFQPHCLDTLFSLLRDTSKIPGPKFSIFCVLRLVLPMLQAWLRRCTFFYGYWDGPITNFKHCCGLCADLVVEFIVVFVGRPQPGDALLDLMLRQLFDVLIECISQPIESISRLGCSCVRHTLVSSGPLLTEEMWQTACESLKRSLDVTTVSLRQVMLLFYANSDNFYGDIGQVKVATRKDTTVMECQRLHHLAQQVFLLPNQVSAADGEVSYDTDSEKSFVLLLYPHQHLNSINPEHIIARIPFHSVVVGLLSHQLILQTIGHLLLSGSSNHIIHSKLHISSNDTNSSESKALPGFLSRLSLRNVCTLLSTLYDSYDLSCDFDSRPGLKFLFQKVARTSVAANLYKQAGLSMSYYVSTLVEICSLLSNDDIEDTKNILQSLSGLANPAAARTSLINDLSNHVEPIAKHVPAFIKLVHLFWIEVSQTYVDLVIDKEGTEAVDRIAQQPLVFLAVQPDDSFEISQGEKWMKLVHQRLHEENGFRPSIDSLPICSQMGFPSTGDDSMSVISDDNQGPLSPERTRSKRESREERESKVYTVASDHTIRSLIAQYKRRKQLSTMPAFVKLSKRKGQTLKDVNHKFSEITSEEIEKQQKSSVLKDSEAHLKSWSELLVTALQLYQQLTDLTFFALLPTSFTAINQLICHAEDPRLKEELSCWFHRLGHQLQLVAPQSLSSSCGDTDQVNDGDAVSTND